MTDRDVEQLAQGFQELSLEEQTEFLGDILRATRRGRMLLVLCDSLQTGESDEEEASLKEHSSLSWIKAHLSWENGDWDQKNELKFPENLRQMIYDLDENKQPRKTLRSDDDLLELLRKGGLTSILMEGWEYAPPRPSSSAEASQFSPEQEVTILQRGFTQPFSGSAVDILEDQLEIYNESYSYDDHYGKGISIVQSSGMGKSRLMYELGLRRIVVNVCFRDINVEDIFPRRGWPPGDKPICAFFSKPIMPVNRGLSAFKDVELTAAFLGALFEATAIAVQNSKTIKSFNNKWAVADFTKFEKSSRYNIFRQIKTRANEALRTNESKLLEFRVDEVENPVSWYHNLFSCLIQPYTGALMEACKSFSPPQTRPLFAFDECSELDKTESKNASLISLQRMIKELEQLDIWSFYLDTTSGISGTHPTTGKSAPSDRLYKDLAPVGVYVALPFNVMVSVANLAKNPYEALSLDKLKFYGRPLWSALERHHLVQSAKHKLMCGSVDPLTRIKALALFSSRLVLELGNNIASNQIAIESVRSHMRILTAKISEEIVTTIAPSEPMLAIAAAEILLHDESVYMDAMSLLIKDLILVDGIVDKGRKGELLGRILLMGARDWTIGITNPTIHQATTRMTFRVPSIPLSEFLKTLLGDNITANTDGKQVLDWAKRYHLNFTHFTELKGHLERVSITFLTECWRRGIALKCADNQANFDMIFVVYDADRLHKPFDIRNFSLVSIQIKLRDSAAPSETIRGLTCPKFISDDRSAEWKPVHLVILMDLGTKTRFQGGGYTRFYHEPASRVSQDPSNADKKLWQGYLPTSQEPNRYAIEVRNCTSAQYPVIRRFVDIRSDNEWADLCQLWRGHGGPGQYNEAQENAFDPLHDLYE